MRRHIKIQFSLLLLFALWSIYSTAQNKIQAFVFLAEECPISIYMTPALKECAEVYQDRVDFIAVFPNSRSNYKTMGVFAEKYGLGVYQRVLDTDQIVSKKYGATITPEVVVVDQNDQIIYRGQISNAYQKVGKRKHGQIENVLNTTLADYLDGKEVPKSWPSAIGCFITFHKKSF